MHITPRHEGNSLDSGSDEAAQAKRAWALAVSLLTSSGITESSARAYFGRLLSANRGLKASDLLGALRTAESTGTGDPRAYLAKAAQGVALRRGDPALKAAWT